MDTDNENDVDVSEAQDILQHLHAEKREKQRLASKPMIDHLEDAVEVVDGLPKFLLNVGDNVIIERYMTNRTKQWLDTRLYTITQISDNGNLSLRDVEIGHHAMSNYITGTKLGYKFKVPTSEKLKKPRKSRKKKEQMEDMIRAEETSETQDLTQADSTKTGGAPEVTEKPKGARVRQTKEASSMRRVYLTKNVVCTRIKSVAYVAPEGTKAKEGERLEFSAPEGGNVQAKHPTEGWVESWTINESL